MGLPKEHYMDAVAIASKGKRVVFKNKNILFKKCVSDGDYQQSQGIRSEQRIPLVKSKGLENLIRWNIWVKNISLKEECLLAMLY